MSENSLPFIKGMSINCLMNYYDLKGRYFYLKISCGLRFVSLSLYRPIDGPTHKIHTDSLIGIFHCVSQIDFKWTLCKSGHCSSDYEPPTFFIVMAANDTGICYSFFKVSGKPNFVSDFKFHFLSNDSLMVRSAPACSSEAQEE